MLNYSLLVLFRLYSSMLDNHRKPPDIRMCRWPAWPLLSKTQTADEDNLEYSFILGIDSHNSAQMICTCLFKNIQALQVYVPKFRPCHMTTPPFLEMCKPTISTHEDSCGHGTSGRDHQCTSSSFSRRKWSFYPGVYTVSSCTTQTPSNASSGQPTSSTVSSYNQTVRRKHTHTKHSLLSRSLQIHQQPHCSANLDKSPTFRKMGVSLQSFS